MISIRLPSQTGQVSTSSRRDLPPPLRVENIKVDTCHTIVLLPSRWMAHDPSRRQSGRTTRATRLRSASAPHPKGRHGVLPGHYKHVLDLPYEPKRVLR